MQPRSPNLEGPPSPGPHRPIPEFNPREDEAAKTLKEQLGNSDSIADQGLSLLLQKCERMENMIKDMREEMDRKFHTIDRSCAYTELHVSMAAELSYQTQHKLLKIDFDLSNGIYLAKQTLMKSNSASEAATQLYEAFRGHVDALQKNMKAHVRN